MIKLKTAFCILREDLKRSVRANAKNILPYRKWKTQNGEAVS